MSKAKSSEQIMPSPILVGTLLVASVMVLGVGFVLLSPSIAPLPAASSSIAGPAPTPTGIVPSSIAVVKVATENPTVAIVTGASSPRATPPVPPPPTAYTPGPTAQFTTFVPIEQWLTLTNREAGFSVRYPPDWYVETPPAAHAGFGSSASFYSYDPKDPFPILKGQTPPPNFSKIEITLVSFADTGGNLQPNETLAEWVDRTRPLPEGSVTAEYEVTIGGVRGFSQRVELTGPSWIDIFVPRGENILLISYPLPLEASFNAAVIRQILDSITFLN